MYVLISAIITIAGTSTVAYILVTQQTPSSPPVIVVCTNGTIVNSTCVPNVVNETKPPVVNDSNPVPPVNDSNPVPPTPVVNQTEKKIDMVGDLSGTAVLNAIKKDNPDLVVALGDLGYQSTLSYFKTNWGTLAGKLVCIPGNHEAPEDGSAALYKETLAYCGNPFFVKMNSVLFLGLDTNGDTNKQLADLKNIPLNGITSVHVMTHKSCAVPPNSHHPVETQAFCDGLKKAFSVKTYFDSAHNHVMSASSDGLYKQSGGGGKSHYTCGTSTAFPFCDAKHYGFLQYIIKPNGETSWKFIDANGGIVK